MVSEGGSRWYLKEGRSLQSKNPLHYEAKKQREREKKIIWAYDDQR